MIRSLARALRVGSPRCIAFIGAGGKTTAMFRLARELPGAVIVTATSHLGAWQMDLADRHIVAETPSPIEELEHGLNDVLLITGPIEGDRTRPVSDDLLKWLHQFCGYYAIPLLIEADGSRQKPLKAWAGHEPPLPAFADLVVQVVGLGGLGKALNAEHVHRPELFAGPSGLRMGEIISAEALVRMLTHPGGVQQKIPGEARRVILLNQADTAQLQSAAKGMAEDLLARCDAVLIASLEQEAIFAVYEPIAGIVLAAGGSTRYGQPKQLLDWRGQPFVRAVAETALQAGLSPVVVVTGAGAEGVEAAVADLPVNVLHNPGWQSGQASSIRVAVTSLGARRAGGAVFLLADQPQVTGSVLRALLERHAEGLQEVVAPMVMDRRANPVLFDRAAFADLLTLEGDTGGRAVFHKYRVEYLPWHDERLLLDVDTPEMYRRLVSDESP